MTKTNFFVNFKMSSVIQYCNYTHDKLKREQLLCQIKAAAAFSDTQIPVVKDIMENIKLNEDRDGLIKRLSQWINLPLSQKYLPI